MGDFENEMLPTSVRATDELNNFVSKKKKKKKKKQFLSRKTRWTDLEGAKQK